MYFFFLFFVYVNSQRNFVPIWKFLIRAFNSRFGSELLKLIVVAVYPYSHPLERPLKSHPPSLPGRRRAISWLETDELRNWITMELKRGSSAIQTYLSLAFEAILNFQICLYTNISLQTDWRTRTIEKKNNNNNFNANQGSIIIHYCHFIRTKKIY